MDLETWPSPNSHLLGNGAEEITERKCLLMISDVVQRASTLLFGGYQFLAAFSFHFRMRWVVFFSRFRKSYWLRDLPLGGERQGRPRSLSLEPRTSGVRIGRRPIQPAVGRNIKSNYCSTDLERAKVVWRSAFRSLRPDLGQRRPT